MITVPIIPSIFLLVDQNEEITSALVNSSTSQRWDYPQGQRRIYQMFSCHCIKYPKMLSMHVRLLFPLWVVLTAACSVLLLYGAYTKSSLPLKVQAPLIPITPHRWLCTHSNKRINIRQDELPRLPSSWLQTLSLLLPQKASLLCLLRPCLHLCYLFSFPLGIFIYLASLMVSLH